MKTLEEIIQDLDQIAYKTDKLMRSDLEMHLEGISKELTEWREAHGLDRETYKMLLEEAHDHHRACLVDAYKILGIDGSDGEFRYKWVALAMGRLVRKVDQLELETTRLKGPISIASHVHTGESKGLECPRCDGDGYLHGDSPAKRCTRCNGSGRINGI